MSFAPKFILLIESRKIKLTEHVAFVREGSTPKKMSGLESKY